MANTKTLTTSKLHKKIETILSDPCASFWIKDAISALMHRDPLDAAIDVEVLAAVFQARADEMLAR